MFKKGVLTLCLLLLVSGCAPKESVTLIIYCDKESHESEMKEVLREKHLEILYDYANFSAYAVKSEELSERECSELIEYLRSLNYVYSVEKDQIMQLDED